MSALAPTTPVMTVPGFNINELEVFVLPYKPKLCYTTDVAKTPFYEFKFLGFGRNDYGDEEYSIFEDIIGKEKLKCPIWVGRTWVPECWMFFDNKPASPDGIARIANLKNLKGIAVPTTALNMVRKRPLITGDIVRRDDWSYEVRAVLRNESFGVVLDMCMLCIY